MNILNFFNNNNYLFNKNYMPRIKESIRWFNLLTFGNSFHKDYCINEDEIVKNIFIGKNPIENNFNYFLKSEINEKKKNRDRYNFRLFCENKQSYEFKK